MSETTKQDKIRKLLALAADTAATPAEAAAAAEMAARLAMMYNIDLDEARKAGQEAKRAFMKGGYENRCSARDRTAFMALASGVGNLYGCSFAFYWRQPHNYFQFIGQAHNVELCNSWLKYLWDACQRFNREHNKWVGIKYARAADRTRADGSFRLHFAFTVADRLAKKLHEMRTQGVSSTGTALVVSHWFDQEKAEVREWMKQEMPGLRQVNSRGNRQMNWGSAIAGAEAGKRVGLDPQIQGSNKPKARRIG